MNINIYVYILYMSHLSLTNQQLIKKARCISLGTSTILPTMMNLSLSLSLPLSVADCSLLQSMKTHGCYWRNPPTSEEETPTHDQVPGSGARACVRAWRADSIPAVRDRVELLVRRRRRMKSPAVCSLQARGVVAGIQGLFFFFFYREIYFVFQRL